MTGPTGIQSGLDPAWLRSQCSGILTSAHKVGLPDPLLSHPQVFDFTFTPEEMKQLDSLNKNWRYIVPQLTVSPSESVNVRFGAGFWPKSGLSLASQREAEWWCWWDCCPGHNGLLFSRGK